MPKMIDVFGAVETDHLRSLAVAYFPGKNASRMSRLDLVPFMLDKMLEEELHGRSTITRRRLDPHDPIPSDLEKSVQRKMEGRYGSTLLRPYLASTFRTSAIASPHGADESSPQAAEDNPQEDVIMDASVQSNSDWPQVVGQDFKDDCVASFRAGTAIKVTATCAVCARRIFNKDILFTKQHVECTRVDAGSIDLELLRINDPHILGRPGEHFSFQDASLNGLALDKAGVFTVEGRTTLDVCNVCMSALTSRSPNVPPLALANDNIRGYLPEHLQDCTWLEERLCAKYLASAYVVRLYDVTAPGAPEERSRVMKGHACSFPLNTVSTALALPWSLQSGGSLISCIVIGPRKPRIEDLRGVFKVRRRKVCDLLHYLRANFKDYPQFPLDDVALAELPDDDVPEAILRQIMHQESEEAIRIFEEETAGLEQHPGITADDDASATEDRTFLEHHGLVDINGISVPAHLRTASALAHATGNERPDLVIKHGSAFVPDYNNPSLFPGMYPTLYPWGTGGFELKRSRPLGMQKHAIHLLDLADASFRRHWSFIFVVSNIQQRRAIHLGSRLACKSKDFERVTRALSNLDSDTVKRIADHVAVGGSLRTLSPQESYIFQLLKQCELLSVKVPGSKAVMNRARANIRSYVGEFGIFHLFLTLNPKGKFSPVFQVFFGDESIDLTLDNVQLPSSTKRSLRLADDPVAGSDYFHFHVAAVFQYLFGWDVRKQQSSQAGGLLGRLSAFFMVKEHTMRGELHGHVLIWLEGGLNPRDLRHRMSEDASFKSRYLAFFDDIIQHHLPSAPVAAENGTTPIVVKRKPREVYWFGPIMRKKKEKQSVCWMTRK